MNNIQLLETGGTINGIIDPDAPPPQESRVFNWLQQQYGMDRAQLQTICMKDSRALDEADRAALADAIRHSNTTQILVPHGTYTMAETGEYLSRALAPHIGSRVVVLVGSLLPLGEAHSDAPQCLRFALEALQIQPPGVWIAMNGKAWRPESVEKDPHSGEFVPRSGQ